MGQMRLDRFLAEMGKGSRSQIRQAVKKGLVQVDGQTVREPDLKLDPETNQVIYAGKQVTYAAYEYFMLNKPAGYVSATEDRREKTVLELIPDKKRKDLFPVGRLDKDTEGLLLITNDGALAHRLLHPKKHVDKTYYAIVRGIMTEETAGQFAAGLEIGDETPTLPARLETLDTQKEYDLQELPGSRKSPEAPDTQAVSFVEVTLHEGRFHQIKRMFEAVGSEVLYLRRTAMGPLRLDPGLATGECRPLTAEEREALGVR